MRVLVYTYVLSVLYQEPLLPKKVFLYRQRSCRGQLGLCLSTFKISKRQIILQKSTTALWFGSEEYKPIGFKTKMLKNFDEFLDDAFKSMKLGEKCLVY